MKELLVISILVFSVSCGNIPVPRNSGGTKATSSSNNPEELSTKTPVVLSAERDPPVQQPKLESPNEEGLTAEEHVQNGVNLLHFGQVEKAKIELYAALRKDPGNKEAVNLVHQINTDVHSYFSEKAFFLYEIKQGDTFSSIAEKYLSDPLKFFVLAKFNGIDDVRKVKIGQKIKIPGRGLTETPIKNAAKSHSKEEKVVTRYSLARKYYEIGKYQHAINLLEEIVEQNSKHIESRDLLVLAYTRYAEALTEKANLLEAQTMLEKALSMQPKNGKLRRQLEELEKRREADHFYQIGITALHSGDEDKAYSYFTKTLKLQPGHPLARKQVVSIKSEVINSYHKKALQYYSKQQLLEAVENWDKVLEIDPDNELAKLYRARALVLQERLNNL